VLHQKFSLLLKRPLMHLDPAIGFPPPFSSSPFCQHHPLFYKPLVSLARHAGPSFRFWGWSGPSPSKTPLQPHALTSCPTGYPEFRLLFFSGLVACRRFSSSAPLPSCFVFLLLWSFLLLVLRFVALALHGPVMSPHFRLFAIRRTACVIRQEFFPTSQSLPRCLPP